MTQLVWGQTNQRRYEAGLDRGVLYPSDGPGVVWNGLVSVEESMDGGEVTPFYFDGVKYLDVASPKSYQATITAFSAPVEFGPCVGDKSVIPGFVLTRQPRSRFGFSYRTWYGDGNYKLHLVYNATANPSNKANASLNGDASAPTQSWSVNAVPPDAGQHKPSAHFMVDSRKIPASALQNLETVLYGSSKENARLPTISELFGLTAFWDPRIIVRQLTTGLTQLVPGSGDLYKSDIDGYYRALPNSRLYKSPVNGIYRME